MEHLIADTGIHFITREIEFNPSEPLILQNGKPLKYAFCEATDFLSEEKIFDLLCYHQADSKYIPVNELLTSDRDVLERTTTGREIVDAAGLVTIKDEAQSALFSTYQDGDKDIYTINLLLSLRVPDPDNAHTKVPAFNLLLDKWLPMPMFRREVDGMTTDVPMGWCRMKLTPIGPGSKQGHNRYRLVWAFDTATTDDFLSTLRPYMENETETYGLCNVANVLLGFLASSDEFHAFSDYIKALLSIPADDVSCRYKAFYIYFLNFIRLAGGAPEVALHNNQHDVPVDMVLDIGNSRTCGVLFEDGDFTKSKMLELRNLTHPWITYENKAFDMHIVFRKTDFGNDIVLDDTLFQWQSMVRVGDEAHDLIYQSLEQQDLAEKTNNYSSPKRYLWDQKPFSGQWENLVTTSDPTGVQLSNDIYVPTLSKHFKADGSFSEQPLSLLNAADQLGDHTHRFSRSSLMTFALIEIFLHAQAQANSVAFRNKWGNKDCRRHLRTIILTCPTAMPVNEQARLRQCAEEALKAIQKCNPKFHIPDIVPSSRAVGITDAYTDPAHRVWSYDEASCCQLVYLYAEIGERYKGEAHKFFEMKGHVRPELQAAGYDRKALTIGTIDIGAGTTDVMVCAYQYEGEGQCMVTPIPLFWDSFYTAGDDILRNIILRFIIEGKDHARPDLGSITSALTARILAMTDDDLQALPCLKHQIVYQNDVDDICSTDDADEKRRKKVTFASNLIHDFFGTDSSMMECVDRRCRVDFNTQVSVPMAQLFMELLRTNRPSRLYTYDDIFQHIKPAAYLLDHFEHHFGFRFETLSWRYEPQEVYDVVKATLEPLLKQLAMVLYKTHCDIIVLSGRPTSLNAITDLFIKHLPVPPHRLVRLNDYRVGSWFATANGQGYFYNQKSIVAVGGMVAYAASHNRLKGLGIDFSKMIQAMTSTANYMGPYNTERQRVEAAPLTPQQSTHTFKATVFPTFIGCQQFNTPHYQARPIYAIYNHSRHNTLSITLSRSFQDNREKLILEEVCDSEGNTLPKDAVELVQQSLVEKQYWLDNGQFELTKRR